ncbi:hypothetical protein ACEQ8H_006978 [Pleosporales sp. CAS-2024a]
MDKLKITQSPKQGCDPEWDIRRCQDWADVQSKLERACQDYDFRRGSENVGKFRRKMRGFVDKSTSTLRQMTKAVPSMDMTSPIVSVANVLLDYRQAAEVRNALTSAFDDLPASFASTDFYCGNYPGDQNIIGASVDFVFTALQASEEAVKFYTSTQVKRAAKAIFVGEDYQKSLSESLESIQSSLNVLMSQAEMSFHHCVHSGTFVAC